MTDTTVKTMWQALSRVLQDGGIDTPVADARLLMQSALKMTREEILMNGDRVVAANDQTALEGLMERRLKHEPVSRILGHRAFWKADFKVTPDTLDPRPDSEAIIVYAMARVKNPKRILDLGTGTGCLLLSLLMEYPDATGIGIDINAGAASVARENAAALGLSDRATFIHTGWDDFKTDEEFDLIVSNPPYIALSEKPDLAPDVALYDPPEALFAGMDGLMAYRSLSRLVPKWLTSEGLALFEIGYTQKDAVTEILAGAGFDVLEVRPDLAGHDRVVIAKKH